MTWHRLGTHAAGAHAVGRKRWIAGCEIARRLLAQCIVGLKDVTGRVKQIVFFFHPQKREREGGSIEGGHRGEEIVIQRACDDCQAVLLHCRCDADITLLPLSSPPCPPPRLPSPRLVCYCPLPPPALSATLSFCGHFPITLSTLSFFSL